MKIPSTLFLSCSVSLLFQGFAHAGAPVPTPPVETIDGVLGKVKIGEFQQDPFFTTQGPSPFGVSYYVDVLDPNSSLTGIAISTSSLVPPGVDSGFYITEPLASAIYLDWVATSYDSTGWNNLFGATLGTFETMFPNDLLVSVFKNIGSPGSNLTEDIDQDMAGWNLDPFDPARPVARFGLFGGFPSTDFVAFSGDTVIDSSQARPSNNVPDGGTTVFLSLLGFGGLGFMHRLLRR